MWPEELIERAAAEAHSVFPPPPYGDHAAAATLGAQAMAHVERDVGTMPFPSLTAPACNEVTLHPRLWRLLAQLLGTEDLRIAEAIVVPKYGIEGKELPWNAAGASPQGDQLMRQCVPLPL